jgi:cell wall-associated NlpC family hydrolase
MSDETSSAGNVLIAAALVPVLGMAVVMLILGAGAQASPPLTPGCGGGGTAQTIGGVKLDAEQMGNARTIVSVTAGRHLPVYAAVITIATAYTEAKLRNSQVQDDHDSEGVLQQRVSIYTKAVADDPVKTTEAFLDRLIGVPNWQANPVGVNAQTVQISQHPQRYQLNAGLAQDVVGQFWAAASAAAGAVPATTPKLGSSAAVGTPAVAAGPAICAGAGGVATGGGAAGAIVGPHGNNVAGTTSIPAGFIISGTPQGTLAVRFALKQLGKPYIWAAAGPDAFDCSGLTMAAWAEAGVALPHLASAQTSAGTPKPPNLSQAVGGDLVMIPGSDGTAANPGHVGMIAGYVDAKDGRHLYIVQAAMTGVPILLTEATQWGAGQIVNVRHIG